MKKIKFLVLPLFAMSFMVSCTKDYSCYCDYQGESLLYSIPNTTKNDAESKCEAYEVDPELVNCTLGE